MPERCGSAGLRGGLDHRQTGERMTARPRTMLVAGLRLGRRSAALDLEVDMPRIRSIARLGLAVGLLALLAGMVLVAASVLAAGDWWLAREPWIGLGLMLLVVGLGLTAAFAVLLDVIEPIGRLRLLAVPPAIVVGLFWAISLLVGVPTTGFGGPERDIGTILYSAPEMLPIVLVATLLMVLPLVLARYVHGGVTAAS
jgi:hypothetical protein